VELAKQFRVPLKVKNSLNDQEGTEVISASAKDKSKGMEEFDVTGVTADKNKVFLKVSLARPTVLSALWERATQAHLSIVAPTFCDGEVRFFTDRDGELEWKKHLEVLSADGFVKEYEIDSSTVPLSVVGNRFSQDGTALAQVVEVLARENIQISLGTASSLAITVGVSEHQVDEGVKALYSEFLEGTK
jgi:aspartokinase